MPPPGPVRSGETTDIAELIERLRALPGCTYIDPAPKGDFNPDEGVNVEMNHAAVTDARNPCPIVGTTSIASCMGVAIFNPATGTGGVAHLAQGDDPLHLSEESRKALLALLAATRSGPEETLEVRLMGPRDAGEFAVPFIIDAVMVLNDQPNLLFLSADFMGKPFAKAFALDTRRWNEGLIKGSSTLYLTFEALKDPRTGDAIIEDSRTVVEAVSDMPEAPHTPTGLYDLRHEKERPASATDDQLDELAAADPSLRQAIELLKGTRRKGKVPE